MLFDTHIHCEYSCDSRMRLTEAIDAAAAAGVGIVVTEHWDDDYPTNPQAFTFNLDEYFATAGPLRSERVLLGLEIGMQKHIAVANDAVAAGHAFDYVLGSVHCVNKRDLYETSCYAGQTKVDAVREFLEEAIACVTLHDNFDAFAHIDYMCRYWPFAGEEPCLAEAPELFDRFFSLLLEKNKPLEINTRRLDDDGATRALARLYRRYHELGGGFCTIGSDAHYTNHVGRRLRDALRLARETGLRPVYFRERTMPPMDFI